MPFDSAIERSGLDFRHLGDLARADAMRRVRMATEDARGAAWRIEQDRVDRLGRRPAPSDRRRRFRSPGRCARPSRRIAPAVAPTDRRTSRASLPQPAALSCRPAPHKVRHMPSLALPEHAQAAMQPDPAPRIHPSAKPSNAVTSVSAGRRTWPGMRLMPPSRAAHSPRFHLDRADRGRVAVACRALTCAAAVAGVTPVRLPACPRQPPAGLGGWGRSMSDRSRLPSPPWTELARTAVDQRQRRRDHGMVRRIEQQGLGQCQAQRHARFGVTRQRFARDAVDQRVKIAHMAQYARDNRVNRVRGLALANPCAAAWGASSSGWPRRKTASSGRGAARRAEAGRSLACRLASGRMDGFGHGVP